LAVPGASRRLQGRLPGPATGSFVADPAWPSVTLVAPLPAGLEPMNPALAATGPRRHRRAILQAPADQSQHPGECVVPTALAEEMYAPETFGRSATARVVVPWPLPQSGMACPRLRPLPGAAAGNSQCLPPLRPIRLASLVTDT